MLEDTQAKEWLQLEGVEYQDVEGEEGVQWHLAAEFPAGGAPTTHIFVPLTQDRLVVQRGTNVSERHRSKLLKLDEDEFRSFKFGLVRDLLNRNVTYILQEEDPQNLTGFVLRNQLRKTPGRNEFIAALQHIHDTTLLAIIHVRRAVGDPI